MWQTLSHLGTFTKGKDSPRGISTLEALQQEDMDRPTVYWHGAAREHPSEIFFQKWLAVPFIFC